jgi:hypothetical protein
MAMFTISAVSTKNAAAPGLAASETLHFWYTQDRNCPTDVHIDSYSEGMKQG